MLNNYCLDSVLGEILNCCKRLLQFCVFQRDTFAEIRDLKLSHCQSSLLIILLFTVRLQFLLTLAYYLVVKYIVSLTCTYTPTRMSIYGCRPDKTFVPVHCI